MTKSSHSVEVNSPPRGELTLTINMTPVEKLCYRNVFEIKFAWYDTNGQLIWFQSLFEDGFVMATIANEITQNRDKELTIDLIEVKALHDLISDYCQCDEVFMIEELSMFYYDEDGYKYSVKL